MTDPESPRSGIGPRIDLAALMDDPHLGDGLEPSVLWRTDRKALLYPAAVNTLHGQPGHGKSWLALHALCQVLREGEQATLVDYENAPAYTALRLREMGLASNEVAPLDYRHASGGITANDVAEIVGSKPALVVIDNTAEALSAAGLVENDGGDVAQWIATVPRLLAEAGVCVLLLDHVRKDGAGRGARGSGHKLSGVSGVSLGISVEVPWSRDVAGSAFLTVAKDRLGFVGPQDSIVARVRFLPSPDGALTVVVDPPDDDDAVPRSPTQRQGGRDVGDLVRLIAEQPYPFPKATEAAEIGEILEWSRRDRVRGAIKEALAAGLLQRSPSGSLVIVKLEPDHLRLVEDAFPGADEMKE